MHVQLEFIMKKNCLCFILSIVLFIGFSSFVLSNQFAYTEDGKKVLLKDDGTWEFVKEEASNKTKFHFRKTRWGMTRKQVKASEKNEIFEENDNEIIYYNKDQVGNLDNAILYNFTNGQLSGAMYHFTKEHDNKHNKHIEDYISMQNLLIKKYSEPRKDDTIWEREEWKNAWGNDSSHWGFSVLFGYLTLRSEWEIGETTIILHLRGNKQKIIHTLVYANPSLIGTSEKKDEEDVLEDL